MKISEVKQERELRECAGKKVVCPFRYGAGSGNWWRISIITGFESRDISPNSITGFGGIPILTASFF